MQVDVGRADIPGIIEGYAGQRGHSAQFLSVGTLDVLGTVLDLSGNPTVLTKVHSKVLLGGTPGGHPHVSVSGPDLFSDLVVGPEVTKRYGVTAEYFSLQTSSPISGMMVFVRNVTR